MVLLVMWPDRFSLMDAAFLSFLFQLREDGHNISSLLYKLLTIPLYFCQTSFRNV